MHDSSPRTHNEKKIYSIDANPLISIYRSSLIENAETMPVFQAVVSVAIINSYGSREKIFTGAPVN
jgi:hypothetical protein